MQSRSVELLVGLFVCLGIAAVFILTMRVSDLSTAQTSAGYTVTAAFDNTGGLKSGAPVELAGVRIGRVTGIKLDQQTYQAVASLHIQDKYKFPKDSSASILTSGLLGDQYIGIEPGGAMEDMQNGDQFILTQSAVILEKLIGQFMTSMTSKSSSDDHSDSGSGDKLFN